MSGERDGMTREPWPIELVNDRVYVAITKVLPLGLKWCLYSHQPFVNVVLAVDKQRSRYLAGITCVFDPLRAYMIDWITDDIGCSLAGSWYSFHMCLSKWTSSSVSYWAQDYLVIKEMGDPDHWNTGLHRDSLLVLQLVLVQLRTRKWQVCWY